MKKLALAVISASALIFGFGVVAEAQYPPAFTVTANPTTGPPSFTTTVTVRGCVVGGGPVNFSLPATPSSATATCAAAATDAGTGSIVGFLFPAQATTGTASVTLTAPAAAGTYPGTATQGTASAGFSIVVTAATTTVPATVPSTGLPATGSDGIGTTTMIAIGLLVLGLGLFVVAQVRRRQPHAA